MELDQLGAGARRSSAELLAVSVRVREGVGCEVSAAAVAATVAASGVLVAAEVEAAGAGGAADAGDAAGCVGEVADPDWLVVAGDADAHWSSCSAVVAPGLSPGGAVSQGLDREA